ncbi:MAG: hypothetical protein U1E91_01735 [Moraxella sp.]
MPYLPLRLPLLIAQAAVRTPLFIITNYLSQVSSDWKSKVGADKTVKWPNASASVGGKGNEGVSSNVQRVANSIGYVEYAYAKQNRLAYTFKTAPVICTTRRFNVCSRIKH